MWDAKRQAIWLATAITLVTLFALHEAREDGTFDPGYFALLEIIFLIVVVVMFYIYSRKKQ